MPHLPHSSPWLALNSLQCTRQPPATQSYPAQPVIVPRVRNPIQHHDISCLNNTKRATPFRDCAFDSWLLLQVTSLISSLLFLLFSLPSTTFPSLDKLYKSLVKKNLGVPGQRLSNFSLHQNHLELVQPQPSGPPNVSDSVNLG